MTWEIIVGLITIIGFFITITTPVLKLNTSITKLNDSIEAMKESIDVLERNNKEGHKRLWDYNTEQDNKINDHEQRITNIEHTMDVVDANNPEFAKYRIKE